MFLLEDAMRTTALIAPALVVLFLAASAHAADPMVNGVWVSDAKDPNLITSTFTFNANGAGSSRLGNTDIVWTFRWTQTGDEVTIKQDEGAKLTIKAKLLDGGKKLRIFSTTNMTQFDDYKRK
jgi:hypothetical protein